MMRVKGFFLLLIFLLSNLILSSFVVTAEPMQREVGVQVGDWVEIGQEIARFLYVNGGAHIHFDVIEKGERSCPRKYFSQEGYNELIAMIMSFNPDWDLCYP